MADGGLDIRAAPEPVANLEAEQSVIGALLYTNSLAEDLVDLKGEHFYEPAHQAVYDEALSLIRRGLHAEPISLGARLSELEALKALGGARYLAELVDKSYQHAARAHADLIINTARLRLLIETADSLRIRALTGTDSFDLIAEAERTFGHMVQDAAPAATNLIDAYASAQTTLDEFDHEAEHGREKGVMTGLRCFDRRLRGLRPGWLVVVAGRPSMGKAQPLDAKVLLRDGTWKAMGDLRLGDKLASNDGTPSMVSGIFPKGERQVYRVTLSDGRSTEACAEHLWQVMCRHWDAPRVLSTADLIGLLSKSRYQGRVWVDAVSGHFGDRADLPLDPWVLGALIGDAKLTEGTPIFSTGDPEMLSEIQDRLGAAFTINHSANYDYRLVAAGGAHQVGVQGVSPNGITTALKALGLHGMTSERKFIPPQYLSASRSQRVDLLRGLLDTDGWIEAHGSVRFCSVSRRLADDVVTLVRSLGGAATVTHRSPTYTHLGERKQGRPAYVINIANLAADDLFTVYKKRARLRASTRTRRLTIKSIVASRTTETQCISVTHPSRLYVTDEYIVTHNTALARAAAFGAARRTKGQVVYFALEMARRELDERSLSQLSHEDGDGIPYMDMGGKLTPYDRQRLRSLAVNVPRNLIIDDSPILSVDYVRRRVIAMKRRGPVSAIFIDYLQIMERPEARGRNEASVIGEMTKGLKQLARETETCVVLLSQINRGVESRDDKRPQLSDLRESGAIEQDANAVLFPYRESYYLQRAEPKDPKKRDQWEIDVETTLRAMDVIAAKVRQGAVGTDHQVYYAEYDVIEDRQEDRLP